MAEKCKKWDRLSSPGIWCTCVICKHDARAEPPQPQWQSAPPSEGEWVWAQKRDHEYYEWDEDPFPVQNHPTEPNPCWRYWPIPIQMPPPPERAEGRECL
jgi:hypothetical protein